MRALQLGAVTGVAAVLIAGGLLGPAVGVSKDDAGKSRMAGLPADLDVEWTVAPTSAVIGASTEYKVRARNRGNVGVANATLTVALPASFAFDSATSTPAGWDCLPLPTPGSSGTITCSINPFPALPPAAAIAELVFVVKPTAAGAAEMTATVAGGPPIDPVTTNNTAKHSTAVVGPSGGGNVDPGYPDFPYGGYGFGYGGYGFGGGGYGYGDYDFDDCYSYCY